VRRYLHQRQEDVSQASGVRLQRLILGLVIFALAAVPLAAKEPRSRQVLREFQRQNPCPATGKPTGACPGWVKDHIHPLGCGGLDTMSNLQWQTISDAKEKDRWERRGCPAR